MFRNLQGGFGKPSDLAGTNVEMTPKDSAVMHARLMLIQRGMSMFTDRVTTSAAGKCHITWDRLCYECILILKSWKYPHL